MEGSDYIGDSAEVIFPITAVQGDIECTYITIVDDYALECSQNFTVSINNATLGTNITSSPNTAVVTIVDNDSK